MYTKRIIEYYISFLHISYLRLLYAQPVTADLHNDQYMIIFAFHFSITFVFLTLDLFAPH